MIEAHEIQLLCIQSTIVVFVSVHNIMLRYSGGVNIFLWNLAIYLRASGCLNTMSMCAECGYTNRFGFGDFSLFTFSVDKPEIYRIECAPSVSARLISCSIRRILLQNSPLGLDASLMTGNRPQCSSIIAIQIRPTVCWTAGVDWTLGDKAGTYRMPTATGVVATERWRRYIDDNVCVCGFVNFNRQKSFSG